MFETLSRCQTYPTPSSSSSLSAQDVGSAVVRKITGFLGRQGENLTKSCDDDSSNAKLVDGVGDDTDWSPRFHAGSRAARARHDPTLLDGRLRCPSSTTVDSIISNFHCRGRYLWASKGVPSTSYLIYCTRHPHRNWLINRESRLLIIGTQYPPV